MEHRFEKDFFLRLKKNWVENGEQLHSGGWKITKETVERIMNERRRRAEYSQPKKQLKILDICCGEGSTCIYINNNYETEIETVTGIDISQYAINNARKKIQLTHNSKINFICESIERLPFENESFDVIIGQDPDGLAYGNTEQIFKEIYRILKPGNGIFTFHHHWIPKNWNSLTNLEEFRKVSNLNHNVNRNIYKTELNKLFNVVEEINIEHLAETHLTECYKKMKSKDNKFNDQWIETMNKFLDKGFKFGVRFWCYK